MLIGPLLVLGACAASIGSIEPPTLAPPPASFADPCNRPIRLPDGEMTQLQVEEFWIIDRSRLVNCSDRHAALGDFFKHRDQLITEGGE